MDKNTTPPVRTPEEALNIIRELRENAARKEQPVEQITAFLHQQSEPSRHENKQTEASALTPAWMPSQERGGVLECTLSFSKIRKVKDIQTKSHDIVTRLRNTWLGRVYRSRLKQYVVVRWVAQCILRNGYPIYVNYLATHLSNRKARRWRPLTKLSDYTKIMEISTYKLVDAALVKTPELKVFPASDQSYLVSPHDGYRFPEIFVATINNAITYGGTNLILADDHVVSHDLYDFGRDYTSEELHGRTLIDPKSSRIRWLLHDEAPEAIPVAATFVDACAANYAHWMSEVLPRVVLFCDEERYKGIPIIVNDGLHKNIMESLFLLAGSDREIITLPIGRALVVDELYFTSTAGYVPFERRTKKLSGHSHGLFSPLAFERIRNHLNALVQKTEKEAWPEKIFLRRNSGARKVTNATELERVLVGRGYVIVEPEKLTFSEQVQLFSNAKIIIGSSGAALANMLFAPQNARIFILISKNPDTSYWYWQNMACASGKIVSYVLGEKHASNSSGIHADFTVDVKNLLQELGEVL